MTTQPPGKPPIPAFGQEWEPLAIDTDVFDGLHRVAVMASDAWTFGPQGPYQMPQTGAAVASAQIREGLMHLLELGLINIDTERLSEAWKRGIPYARLGADRQPGEGQ